MRHANTVPGILYAGSSKELAHPGDSSSAQMTAFILAPQAVRSSGKDPPVISKAI